MKRFFSKKPVVIILSIILAILTIVAVCNAVFAAKALEYQRGVAVCDEWSSQDKFDMSKTQTIDMGKDDFKVLCLTDIHIRNHATFAAAFGVNMVLDAAGEIQLKKMIERENPDLIVITGDTMLTAWNDISLEKFVKFMDQFKIPWAPIYGNHDYEGRADKAKLSEIYLNSEYCLFQCGPEGMNGMGNYILSLQRNGEPVYSFFLFDNGQYRIVDGAITDGGIGKNQIEWYKWAVNGINQAAGKKVPNMAFMHVPIPEYKEIKESDIIDGILGETPCTAVENDGFFTAFKENGGTHMFAAHDHNNNFIADYQGVKLCYTTKSSYNCYFTTKALGGLVINFGQDNKPELQIVDF